MRKGINGSILVLGLSLAACCVTPHTPDGRPCRYTDRYSMDDGFTDAEQEDTSLAARAWTRSTGVCFERVSSTSKADVRLHVAHRQDFYALFMGHPNEQEHGIGATSGRHIWLMPEKEAYTADFTASAAHEFGHFLGLDHSTTGLMMPSDGSLENGEIPWSTVQEYWNHARYSASLSK